MSQSWKMYQTTSWNTESAMIAYGISGDTPFPAPKKEPTIRMSSMMMVAQNVACPMRSWITEGRYFTLSITVMPPYDQRVRCFQSLPNVSGTTVQASELMADFTLHPEVLRRVVIS